MTISPPFFPSAITSRAPVGFAPVASTRALLCNGLALLLVCAFAGPAHARQWYNLNIIVYNTSTNAGIPGALVTIDQDFGNGTTRYTDGGGFSNFGVTEAQIYFSASAAGFSAGYGDVYITDHHTAYVGLTPQAPTTQPYTFVVNGTGDSNPDWIQTWHPFMVGIANTYGVPPIRVIWNSNSVCQVSSCSGYAGIIAGAAQFADRVQQFGVPNTSQLNFIGFSHGANVAHVANQWYISRAADHFVQIAMPHNSDIRSNVAVRQYGRHCSVYSSSDNVVMAGSSQYQQANYSYNIVMANYYYNEAFHASQSGNWSDAEYYYQVSLMYESFAFTWWMDVRYDPFAANFHAGAYAHTDMHYDWMFTGLPSWCKTN